MNIPDEILELIEEYKKKYGKRPDKGFNYDEWDSLGQYKGYLEKELKR